MTAIGHLSRIILSLLTGLLIAAALLWTMQWMLLQKTPGLQAGADRPVMEFVRLKHDSQTNLRQRRELEPEPEPEQPPPPKPELAQTDHSRPNIKAPPISFSIPKTDLSLGGPYLGPVTQGPPDREFMAVSRVPPQYPYRAKRRGIEGWVDVSFMITEQGDVQDAVVVESDPKGIFDDAAIQALLKWKFKPRIEDGKPVAVRVKQKVTFNLDG